MICRTPNGQWGQSILNVDGRYLVLFSQSGIQPDITVARGPGVMLLGAEGQMLWWDYWTSTVYNRFTNEMGTLNEVDLDGSVLPPLPRVCDSWLSQQGPIPRTYVVFCPRGEL